MERCSIPSVRSFFPSFGGAVVQAVWDGGGPPQARAQAPPRPVHPRGREGARHGQGRHGGAHKVDREGRREEAAAGRPATRNSEGWAGGPGLGGLGGLGAGGGARVVGVWGWGIGAGGLGLGVGLGVGVKG